MAGSSNVCLDLLNCFRFESKVVGRGEGGELVPVANSAGAGWASEGLTADELATREGGGVGERKDWVMWFRIPRLKQKLEYRRSISFFVKYVKCCVAVGDVEGKKKCHPPCR